VKQGTLGQGKYIHPNALYSVDPEDYETKEDMKIHLYEKKRQLMRGGTMPVGKRPVIKNNKIVYQRDKLTNEESSRQTAEAAYEVMTDIQNNRVGVPSEMTPGQAKEYLQGLIFDQMLRKPRKNTLTSRGRGRSRCGGRGAPRTAKFITRKQAQEMAQPAPVYYEEAISDDDEDEICEDSETQYEYTDDYEDDYEE
jgi:hypothetical protein